MEYRFFENGKFEQYFEPTGNEVHDGGTYTLEGDQITFTNTRGHCVGEEGLYTWTLDGKILKFTILKDLCTTRKGDLENYLYEMIASE